MIEFVASLFTLFIKVDIRAIELRKRLLICSIVIFLKIFGAGLSYSWVE